MLPDHAVPALDAGAIAHFVNSYATLPAHFFARLAPTPVSKPELIAFNHALAAELGLAETPPEILTQIFAGNLIPAGAAPLAQAYAGHQFGNFVPQLGDGRAILLGEVIDRTGRRRDIQLKGAGPTPFSRRGDGRAALGPVLREYLVSEAMHALNIPTTRALAAVATGDWVFRETAVPGAIVTRVAASHIRVGTFQFFAARGDEAALKILADHVIARHYPAAAAAENPYLALLDSVIAAQAALIASWLGIGFIHGVMNTDNMAISGETIDFGPCAFMDTYDPATVYSAIDEHGRYAYANQPPIAHWNLARFAETLLPLLDNDPETALKIGGDAINKFAALHQANFVAVFRAKLGLAETEEADGDLIKSLLAIMQEGQADFTHTFRTLYTDDARKNFRNPESFDEWAAKFHARLAREGATPATRAAAMRAQNPAFIPRNHRIEQVIQAALRGDFAPFHELSNILARPYEDQPDHAAYMQPPHPSERVLQTFCGT